MNSLPFMSNLDQGMNADSNHLSAHHQVYPANHPTLSTHAACVPTASSTTSNGLPLTSQILSSWPLSVTGNLACPEGFSRVDLGLRRGRWKISGFGEALTLLCSGSAKP